MTAKRMPLTDEEKRVIVELYNSGWPINHIAKRLGRNDSTVGRFLKREGYETPGRHAKISRIHWTKDEVETIIRLYTEEGLTTEQLAQLYSHRTSCPETIGNLLKRHGVTLRPRGVPAKLTRHDYFSVIDTEAKAYFLGLLLADGSILCNKAGIPNSVVISLVHHDAYVLEKFREEVGSSNTLIFDERPGRKPMVVLRLSSQVMAKDLAKYGIVPKKTYVDLSLPNIAPELMRHFIRGVFDGDGTVYTYHQGNWLQLTYGFYGNYHFLVELRDFLVAELGLAHRKVFNKGSVALVYFSRKHDVSAFYHYIYDDATIYLERKRRIFDEYLANTEVTTAVA